MSRPDGPSLTEILAAFVAETPAARIPEATVAPAKNLILDTMGVALAATRRPIGDIVCGYLKQACASPGTATILGAGARSSPELAALANGTLANALDFDEGSHLSTHVLPAALAVAEHEGLTGRDLLEAFILAHEAGARLTQTIDAGRRRQKGPTALGWWHVGLVGPVAAALAACRLLKLDRRQTATAIGIATCSSGGFRRNMGTMAKALHSGHAARAGVEAASLARRGFTADPAILEAPLGFLAAVCPPEDRDATAITERLGRPYALEGTLRLKRFPACNPGHPLIDAALQFRDDDVAPWSEIDSIDADLHTFSLLRLDPGDEHEAGFSGAFLLAATLIHGAFGLDHLTEETLHDSRVRDLMRRIRHVPAAKPETMVVHLRGGRSVTVEVPPVRRLPPGDAVREKFRRCAGEVLSGPAVEEIEARILALDAQPDISRLMALAGGVAKK